MGFYSRTAFKYPLLFTHDNKNFLSLISSSPSPLFPGIIIIFSSSLYSPKKNLTEKQHRQSRIYCSPLQRSKALLFLPQPNNNMPSRNNTIIIEYRQSPQEDDDSTSLIYYPGERYPRPPPSEDDVPELIEDDGEDEYNSSSGKECDRFSLTPILDGSIIQLNRSSPPNHSSRRYYNWASAKAR